MEVGIVQPKVVMERTLSQLEAMIVSDVKKRRKRWSYFIRKVYETDPLTSPKCQGKMRIISFIEQPEVIKKILQRLALWKDDHAQ